MTILKALDGCIYRASLKLARDAKDRYHRRRMIEANTGLVDVFAPDWDEEDREREYQTKVLPYWEKFGRAPRRFWFELAGSRDRKMEPGYIPSDLYYLELLPYMNNLQFRFALEDKNSLDLRFPDVKQARTVCRKMAGEYYDGDMNLIGEDEAVKLCLEEGARGEDGEDGKNAELFIKPTLYSGFGKGIQRFRPSQCSLEKIRELFRETGANHIVQEAIIQHEVLSSMNPDSVSTIRVTSLFMDGEVYIPNVYIRVGVPGSSHVVVGSEYNAQILPDGSISPMICLDEGGWFDNRVEGIFDEGIIIPGMDRVLAEARRLHPRVGHFKWIGWDFTLDQDGDPLLIEFNTTPGDNAQRVCGRPLFGEMTDRVLEDYFSTRSLESNQVGGAWITNEDIRKYRE